MKLEHTDAWDVTFGTSRRALGAMPTNTVPSLAVYQSPYNGLFATDIYVATRALNFRNA